MNTCRSKGPPKPGSCSKELRPPLRISRKKWKISSTMDLAFKKKCEEISFFGKKDRLKHRTKK